MKESVSSVKKAKEDRRPNKQVYQGEELSLTGSIGFTVA